MTERGQAWQAVQERNRRRDELRARVEMVARGLREVAERALAEARARLEAVRERFDRAAVAIREWVGREQARDEPDRTFRPGLEPARPKADVAPARAAPAERDRLLGRDATRGPDRGKVPTEPARRDALLGRGKAPEAERTPDRAALLGKGARPAVDRQAPTSGDLLGRKPGQAVPERSDRSKGGGRER